MVGYRGAFLLPGSSGWTQACWKPRHVPQKLANSVTPAVPVWPLKEAVVFINVHLPNLVPLVKNSTRLTPERVKPTAALLWSLFFSPFLMKSWVAVSLHEGK